VVGLPVSGGGFACGVGCGSGDQFGRLERRGEVIIGNIIMKAGRLWLPSARARIMRGCTGVLYLATK